MGVRTGRDYGQVIVLFAIFFTVLLILVGSAYDYGAILVTDTQVQNAVDAAALAGADALARGATNPTATQVGAARATTVANLALNGVATQTPGTTVTIAFPTSTPGSGATNPPVENLTISVRREHPTVFWTLAGIDRVSVVGAGAAHASRGMLDIMLSLDATGSEIFSGSWPSIQSAVVQFINVVNPTLTDPRGARIGIARFAGIKCTWYDDTNDGLMNVYSTSTPASEYRPPCVDDRTVLTRLTADKQLLLKLANNSGASACPASSVYPAGQSVAEYACPLRHAHYAAPAALGSGFAQDICRDGGVACDGGTPMYMRWWPQTPGFSGAPYFTGTKLPNAFSVLSESTPPPPDASPAFYAWSTANGGRNDVARGNNARKVLVMFTDGQNEAFPTAQVQPDPAFPEDVGAYAAQARALADSLKRGPDQQAGTDDDVEIFVVGYFCTPYDNSPPGSSSSSFCKSRLAATASPHPCPGATYPPSGATPSSVDDLLVALSSSSPGSCDRYFPLSKTETTTLPQLFAGLAGTISRGQLTQ